MKNIITRFATTDDIAQLAQLSILFEQHFINIDNETKPTRAAEFHTNRIYDYIFGPDKFMRAIVAESNGRVVGAAYLYYGFRNGSGKALDIPYFMIHPDFRGSSVFMELYNEIKELAHAENINKVIFSVYGKNKGAVKLYEKIGAKYYADEDEHFMYIELDT
jgi:GNAT superfamily N-acetyltransferase